MVCWKNIVATLGVAALIAAPVASAAASPGESHVAPSTKANALTAMHGEAFAYGTYMAYAAQAARTGEPRLARLFTRTADVELTRHFAEEAALVRLVGTDSANLQDAIAGEEYEYTTMYPGFAAQATLDGCPAAADLFTEIAADEVGHAAAYRTALEALRHPHVSVPAPPVLDEVEITASTPACTGATQDNLEAAMHGEAFAHAKYSLYAEHARHAGRPALAALFAGTAEIELREHFAAEAVLAGLVGSNEANLANAVADETAEATSVYPGFAVQAARVGDLRAAGLFRQIGHQESAHARAGGFGDQQ